MQRYLALYEIEADDVNAVMDEASARLGTERMTITDALDQDSVVAAIYEEFGARMAR